MTLYPDFFLNFVCGVFGHSRAVHLQVRLRGGGEVQLVERVFILGENEI